jgi:pimeloyl-ACP methyl ester carboxylesterase
MTHRFCGGDVSATPLRAITVDGATIVSRRWQPAYDETTASPSAIVLVHGMVVASRSMEPLGRALAARGITVVAPDLPGFGRSAKPARALDVDEHADALAGWMRTAAPAGAAVLGNSFGSQIAAAVAQRHPALVPRLVLIAPTIDPEQRRLALRAMPFLDRPARRSRQARLPAAQRWRDRAQRGFLRASAWRLGEQPSLGQLLLIEYLSAGLLRAVSTYRHSIRDDIAGRLARISVPTLVVRGENDHVVRAGWARRATGLLHDGHLATVPGADHSGQLTAAEPIADLVVAFLRGHHVQPTG